MTKRRWRKECRLWLSPRSNLGREECRPPSPPGGRVVPQEERGFQGHECSSMLGNQSRGVGGRRASRGHTGGVQETVFRTDEALATIHRPPEGGITILPARA